LTQVKRWIYSVLAVTGLALLGYFVVGFGASGNELGREYGLPGGLIDQEISGSSHLVDKTKLGHVRVFEDINVLNEPVNAEQFIADLPIRNPGINEELLGDDQRKFKRLTWYLFPQFGVFP
jgi:hypothetical protein